MKILKKKKREIKMKQMTLEGKVLDYKRFTCDQCERMYFKHLNKGRVRKCNHKPRGFGYDLKKDQQACIKFKRRK